MKSVAPMIRPALFGFGLLALAACDMSPLGGAVQETMNVNAREAAKAVVIPIVMQTEIAPGVTIPEPLAVGLTSCVIDSASAEELARLAGAAVTGTNADTTFLVSDILKRPETTTCATQVLTQA
jgi:hypothetical protein